MSVVDYKNSASAETLVEDLNQGLSLIVTSTRGKNLSRNVVKQALKKFVNINEISGIAQILPSLEWCVSVKSVDTLKTLLRTPTVKDDEGNEICFKKMGNQLFGRIGGLPVQIPDTVVYSFLMKYGSVTSLKREYEVDEGVTIFTGPRKFTIELYKNVMKEDFPCVAKISGVMVFIKVCEQHVCSVLCSSACPMKLNVTELCLGKNDASKDSKKLTEDAVLNMPASRSATSFEMTSEKLFVTKLHECALLYFHAELRKHREQLISHLSRYKVKAVRTFMSEHNVKSARRKIVRPSVLQYFEFYGFESLPDQVVNDMLQLKSVYDDLLKM